MTRFPLLIVLTLLLTLMPAPDCFAAEPTEEYFAIPAATAGVTLKGSIDMPAHTDPDSPIVLLAGAAYTSADGTPYVAPNAQARHGRFYYRDIGTALARRGYPVVRLDQRGLGSVRACERAAGRELGPYDYVGRSQCFDVDAAVSTTLDTRVDDLVAVIGMIGRRWPGRPLIIAAHADGAVPVSILVEQQRAAPLSLIFLSAAAGSSKAMYHWQYVGRQLGWVAGLLADGRAQVSNADIDALDLEKRALFNTALLASPTGAWTGATLPQLGARLQQHYEEELRQLLRRPPGLPHFTTLGDGALPNVPAVSAAYMNSLLSDETSTLARLAGFDGPVTFLYGDRDVLIDVDHQMALLAQAGRQPNISAVKLARTHHWLGRPEGGTQPAVLDAIAERVAAATRFARHRSACPGSATPSNHPCIR